MIKRFRLSQILQMVANELAIILLLLLFLLVPSHLNLGRLVLPVFEKITFLER